MILCFSIGAFFGLTTGGIGGRYLYRIDKRYPALLAGFAAIAGCIPFWILLNGVHVDSTTPTTIASRIYISVIAIITGTLCGITGPIIKATLQNVTPPNARGQAFAIMNTFDDFGKGLGPVFLAKMITTMGGRTIAFNVGTLGWVVCGILNILIYFTATSDEDRKVLHLQTEGLYINNKGE